MSIDTYQAKVKSSIWKAIAQSELPISSIPMEQQNKFVDTLPLQLSLYAILMIPKRFTNYCGRPGLQLARNMD
jgi:hypothetical protein